MRARSCRKAPLAPLAPRIRSLARALALLLSVLAPQLYAEGLELGLDAEASLGLRVWSEEYFTSLGSAAPSGSCAVSCRVEPSIALDIFPGLSLAATGGIEGEGATDADKVRASIPEAYLSLGIVDGVFLRGGILALPSGPDPFFKPAFWPSRFTPNVYATGGTSFLALQASAYFGGFKLGLLCLPDIGFAVLDLFQKPTGSAAEARISYSLLGGSAALFGVGLAEAGSLIPSEGGFGFDAAFPIGDRADIRGEGLYSSSLAFALSAGCTALSVLELRAGYSYAEESSSQHTLSLTAILPKITDSIGFSVFALVNPEDLSSRCFAELFLETAAGTRLRLRGELGGTGPIRAAASFLVDVSHRESF